VKIVLLSTFELNGGAAIACNRLMKALQKNGVEVNMLVRDKNSDDINVTSINSSWITGKLNYFRFVWERLIIFFNNHFSRPDLFKVSIANTGTNIVRHPLVKEADIIHLHWINQGFLSLKDIKALIKTGKPIVWTMHDMWACTGICHHSWGCEYFTERCGNCPLLHSGKNKDLSYRIFKSKLFISQSDMHLVTVSSWLKSMAQKSAITQKMKISVIPNVIDLRIFQPVNKNEAHEAFLLPRDKKIITMGAYKIDDPIKGFSLLKQALRKIYEQEKDILLVLFGNIKNIKILEDIRFPYTYLGTIRERSRIALLYNASDVNVVPSYYETFGQTITESMACGCPSVSFNNSGQTDIIDHQVNGYLAEFKNADDLAAGISWVLSQDKKEITEACIKKVRSCYTENMVAQQHIDLYKNLMNK
jgi:glycosyltransferase involved in cell wall biosynthesis